MKNSFIIKNIRISLLKQLIFPVLLLLVSLAVFIKTPKSNYFNPRPLNYKSRYENFYNRDLPHVVTTVADLHYSGLDYTVNSRIKGHYYYTLTDGFCQFYVLPCQSRSTVTTEYKSLKLKGRLIRLDDIEYHSIIKNLSKTLGWTGTSLKKISSAYAVSTLPEPIYFNLLFYAVLYGCLIISILDILCSVIYIIEPSRSPTFRYLGSFGELRTLLPKVEIELKHIGIEPSGNIYLTPNYIVNIDTVKSLILPLDSVIWVYYHGDMLQLLGRHLRLNYTLHVLTADGRAFDFTKKKKEDLNVILAALEEHRPEILLRYSEKNKALAKKRIHKKKK